jgi:allophanate hydrolase
VVQPLLDTRPDALDPTVRGIVAGAAAFSATDAFRALYRLRDAQRRHAAVWHDVDALMVPTAPGHPTFAEVDDDPVGVNARLGRYTNFVNLLGWCALALPAGRTVRGLPFGVTFIAPGGGDAALARFGLQWEADVGGVPKDGWPAAAPALPIAVVGAHLSGLPLNAQLTALGARLREATTTAPHYRLHALPGTRPPKPGLVRVPCDGSAIALEVWEVPRAAVGEFLAGIAPPLGLGSVELASGEHVHGFLCESHAIAGAPDISAWGGWRAWLAAREAGA